MTPTLANFPYGHAFPFYSCLQYFYGGVRELHVQRALALARKAQTRSILLHDLKADHAEQCEKYRARSCKKRPSFAATAATHVKVYDFVKI